MNDFCRQCGQFNDDETTEKLWDAYWRSPDPRHDSEPLVFFASDEDEDWLGDEGFDPRMMAMEKDMAQRGLCTDCGRPDLSRLDLDRYPLMTDEDLTAHYEMIAEQAAERRAGC